MELTPEKIFETSMLMVSCVAFVLLVLLLTMIQKRRKRLMTQEAYERGQQLLINEEAEFIFQPAHELVHFLGPLAYGAIHVQWIADHKTGNTAVLHNLTQFIPAPLGFHSGNRPQGQRNAQLVGPSQPHALGAVINPQVNRHNEV